MTPLRLAARSKGRNAEDARGRVKISVFLLEEGGGGPKAGNIYRSVTVRDATVSEVIEEIRKVIRL